MLVPLSFVSSSHLRVCLPSHVHTSVWSLHVLSVNLALAPLACCFGKQFFICIKPPVRFVSHKAEEKKKCFISFVCCPQLRKSSLSEVYIKPDKTSFITPCCVSTQANNFCSYIKSASYILYSS